MVAMEIEGIALDDRDLSISTFGSAAPGVLSNIERSNGEKSGLALRAGFIGFLGMVPTIGTVKWL